MPLELPLLGTTGEPPRPTALQRAPSENTGRAWGFPTQDQAGLDSITGKVTVTDDAAQGGQRTLVLGEEDKLWQELRAQPLGDVIERITELVTEFTSTNEFALGRQKRREDLSMAQLKNMVKDLPEYQEQGALLSKHMKILEYLTQNCLTPELNTLEIDIIAGTVNGAGILNYAVTNKLNRSTTLRLMLIFAISRPKQFLAMVKVELEGEKGKLAFMLLEEDLVALHGAAAYAMDLNGRSRARSHVPNWRVMTRFVKTVLEKPLPRWANFNPVNSFIQGIYLKQKDLKASQLKQFDLGCHHRGEARMAHHILYHLIRRFTIRFSRSFRL